MSKYQNDRQFEDDVRRTADAVFEIPAGGCKSRLFKKGKSHIEIDGVAESRYVTHLLMATTSTKFQKVKEDVEKLVFAASKERQRGVAVKSWMIVEKTPEAPHTTHAREHDVELLSMRQFRERFFDGRDYVMKREHAVFGSARDLDTESITVAADEFIEPPMTNLETRLPIAFDDLLQKVAQGFTLVLLAPFGSGKSLTVRQLWFALRDKYLSAEIDCVPVAINLREHWGAQYADEIFLRHGRSLSLHREGDLTVAWRTGSLALLIDGFDEVASQGVVQIEKSEVLREIRRTALAGVKEMVLKSPDATGIVLAGRDHYFDNDAEMLHALGLRSHKLVRVRIEEFDEDRAAQYLKRKGFSSPLPDWLPRRPLLLGYLARRQLLQDVLSIDFSQGRARAWVDLVNLICKREAEHERAAMDADTVRQVLETLSLEVRATPTGAGPISASMLVQAYTTATGQAAGDAVTMQLQRLPGLTARDAEPGTRSFIEQEFLETLQGLGIARLLFQGARTGPEARSRGNPVDHRRWMGSLDELAASVAVYELRQAKWTYDTLQEFIRQNSDCQLGGDLFQVAMTWAAEDAAVLDLRGVTLSGVHVSEVNLDDAGVSGLRIRDSLVDRVVLGAFVSQSSVSFANCHINKVAGAISQSKLPEGIEITGATGETSFDTLDTTDAIVQFNVEDSVKALLVSLKKLFRQRGSGRVVGAFHRGLPQSIEVYVEPVLKMLINQGIAWKLRDVYHPVRKHSRRVHQLLDNPFASNDELLQRAKSLG